MEGLKETIREVLNCKKILGLKSLSDDMILECSTKIFISNFIQTSKQKNIESMKADKTQESEPATERQLLFLEKLGYEGTSELSKQEAHALIEELKNSREKNVNPQNFDDY